MEQNIELRIVDPKTLKFIDNRDPRHIPADRMADAALKANAKAIGFLQPPLFSQEEDGSLTIILGRRRVRTAIANKQKELAILVKPADPLDNMRAVSENVIRAPMSPVDLWRSIESLASENWTEEALATAFAIPVRQVRKLRLLGNILPAILEHIGRGDMPSERELRVIAAAPLSEQTEAWEANKPRKKAEVSWCDLARALSKHEMFARNAKFGEKEQTAFGIVWIEDLFAPANEDSRYTTDAEAFLAAQRAWLEANLPENGEIIEADDYGSAKLPKGAERVWSSKPAEGDRIGFYIAPRDGSVKDIAFRRPTPLKGENSATAGGDDSGAIPSKTRPDITNKGMEMIGEMRTEALSAALTQSEISDQTIIGLLLLALSADNVSIRTNDSTPTRSLVAKIAEGGKLTSDTTLIRSVAVEVLRNTLNCKLKYNGSGLAARIAGDEIGADAELPTMATDDFLSTLSRKALEQLGSGLGVLPRQRVKETRVAIVEQARDTRVVLPAAHFALSAEESAKFSQEPYRYGVNTEAEADDGTDENGDLAEFGESGEPPHGETEDAGEAETSFEDDEAEQGKAA
ncbi:ParB N-terminal domain-containing protein [uncultured Rhodoblastus sp.]|uniref:ParB N-terminal domain-containing protein n=1 Tax=uncultured Rhodoblastus sp. TaxID=543037 RepID=UPI0025E6924A|nr:ParB N-terminal domain-containing protein [uncultured Rhodoblastus sp.]